MRVRGVVGRSLLQRRDHHHGGRRRRRRRSSTARFVVDRRERPTIGTVVEFHVFGGARHDRPARQAILEPDVGGRDLYVGGIGRRRWDSTIGHGHYRDRYVVVVVVVWRVGFNFFCCLDVLPPFVSPGFSCVCGPLNRLFVCVVFSSVDPLSWRARWQN